MSKTPALPLPVDPIGTSAYRDGLKDDCRSGKYAVAMQIVAGRVHLHAVMNGHCDPLWGREHGGFPSVEEAIRTAVRKFKSGTDGHALTVPKLVFGTWRFIAVKPEVIAAAVAPLPTKAAA